MKSLPKHVKIGVHRYRIILVDVPDDIETKNSAAVNRQCGTIMIDKSLMSSEMLVAFLHESIHVMNGELTETDVDFMAQSLAQFLVDNKLFKL